MSIPTREYLGDGVYATLAGDGIITLIANNPPTDMIIVEPEVRDALYSFLGRAMAQGDG
jgi:hypothetical protein